jgi:hypothetical protein
MTLIVVSARIPADLPGGCAEAMISPPYAALGIIPCGSITYLRAAPWSNSW